MLFNQLYSNHFGRLLQMVYPEESITYWFNTAGQLDHVLGEKAYGYVTSEFAGWQTMSDKFTFYVSPSTVANQGGQA